MKRSGLALTVLTAAAGVAIAGGARGQASSRVPIDELGTGLYLNEYEGGLYPGGSNVVPAAHATAGLIRSANVGPLDLAGQPDPAGKFVLLSIGMSNTAQEWAGGNSPLSYQPYSLMGQAAAHPAVDHASMVIFNGGRGGQTAGTWDSPADNNYASVATALSGNGLSEAQVRAAWVKVANAGPSSSLPNANADANLLIQQSGNIVRALKTRYPNLELVFLSSRIHAGYATTPLNPEPYAYESGFTVKRLIEAQINQMSGSAIDPLAGNLNSGAGGVAPWIGWGPYLWADGANPRGTDGLTWLPSDFSSDGTHPSNAGREKVATLLMRQFINSPLARDWFLRYERGDANLSGQVDFDDYVRIDNGFNSGLTGWVNGDFNHSGVVDFDDYVLIDVAFNHQDGTLARAIEYLDGTDRSESGRAATGVQKVIEHFEQFGAPYASTFLSAVPEPAMLALLALLGVPALAGAFNHTRKRRV